MQTFEKLKQRLIESPVLAIYDPTAETELHTDASSLGYGAILMQRQKDKKMHAIFYFSKRTTPIESKYHSYELELLAIVNALQRFRIYLQGLAFKIITDYKRNRLIQEFYDGHLFYKIMTTQLNIEQANV